MILPTQLNAERAIQHVKQHVKDVNINKYSKMKGFANIWNYVKAFFLVWGKMYRAVFYNEKNKTTVEKVKHRLDKAIKEADDKHIIDGKRYYVLSYNAKDPKFVVLNRAEIKVAQKRGIINRKLDIYQVLNLCRYMTK